VDSLFFIALYICIIIPLIFLFTWNIRLRRRLGQGSAAHHQAKNRFKVIYEAAADAIILYDPESEKIIDFNPAVSAVFGYAPEEIYHLDLETICSGGGGNDLNNARLAIKEALKGIPQTYDLQLNVQSEKKRWVEIRMQKIAFLQKLHLLIFVSEISERKKTEQRLYRLINIVDQIGEGIATADLNGIVTYVNQAWADMHGYSPKNLIGKHLSIFHDDDQNASEVVPFNKKVLRRGYNSGEIGHKRSDGRVFATHMTTTLQKDENGRVLGFIGVATDLSDQKKVEAALRESEIKFRHLFNLSPQPISFTDLNGTFLDVNQKFCETLQYSRNEIIGKDSLDLGFPAEDRRQFIDSLIENGEVAGYEISHKIKNKKSIQVQLYSKLIHIKDKFYTLTVYHDITPQRTLEAQLVQAQKMEAIGTLAGGIAHDFNNILSAILGYIELSRIYVEPGSKVSQYLEEEFKAANRAKELVRQILSISRQSEQRRKAVDINNIILDVLTMLKTTIPSSIGIKKKLKKEDCSIEADPVQINQVIMNLLTNAGQAMRDKGGLLTVSVDTVMIESSLKGDLSGLKTGKYVKVCISDTGHGIKPEDKKRIFDPYYTTKAKGVGTGLGLAVSQSIVKKHGGAISFSSEPGKGADFFIYLPIIDESLIHKGAGPMVDSLLPVGNEYILFVDDEETIIETGKEMLEYLGYLVETSSNSEDALDLFKSRPQQFDLVITDMTMPGMNGDVFSKKILEIRPDIPIIICTGYNPQINETIAKKNGLKAFIFKPLTFKKLATTVRNVLDGKTG
jgi:PAS domain S-box-containing protein